MKTLCRPHPACKRQHNAFAIPPQPELRDGGEMRMAVQQAFDAVCTIGLLATGMVILEASVSLVGASCRELLAKLAAFCASAQSH